jgi:hypothetical protein
MSYTYNITVSAWGIFGLNPLPLGLLPAGWLPVAPADGGTGGVGCPQGYVCCITSVINNTNAITINARKGYIRQVSVTVNTTLSIGNCQLAACPCPAPKVTTNPKQELKIEIEQFPET